MAAHRLGIPFDGATIASAADSAGRIQGVRPPEAVTSCPDATEDYLVYLYAGAAAVREFCDGDAVTGASDDELRAQQAAGFVFREPRDYRERLARARVRARGVVRADRAQVEAVAAVLIREGEVSAEEVARAVAAGVSDAA